MVGLLVMLINVMIPYSVDDAFDNWTLDEKCDGGERSTFSLPLFVTPKMHSIVNRSLHKMNYV